MQTKLRSIWDVVFKTPLIRRILLFSLAITVFLPLYEYKWTYPRFEQLLIANMEDEAKRTASHLSVTLLAMNTSLTHDNLPSEFIQKIQSYSKHLKLEKVKVFSESGEVVYSTNPADIGKHNKHAYFRDTVALGGIYTKLVLKNRTTLEGRKVAVDIMETYIPIMRAGIFIGAFEIYYDISDKMMMLNQELIKSSRIFFTFIIVLFAALLVMILRSAQEVIGRIAVERELRDSEKKFKAMASSAQDAVIMMDNQGRVTFWNKGAQRIFGYSESEILGADLHTTIVPEKYLSAFQAGFIGFQESGTGTAVGQTIELTGLVKAGKEVPIEMSLAATKLNGSWHAVANVRDITDRKRMEERERHASYLEGVAEMGVSVLHNIGNAIMSIIYRAEAIEKNSMELEQIATILSRIEPLVRKKLASGKTDQETLFELLQVIEEVGGKIKIMAVEHFTGNARPIRNGVESIGELIKQQQKTTSGPKTIVASPHFDLRHLIEDAVLMQKDQLEHVGVIAEITVGPGLDRLYVPRSQLLNLVNGLIKNSYEAIKMRLNEEQFRGLIQIHANMDEDGKRLIMVVEDNGCGILEKHLTEIFQSGFTTKNGRAGFGLHGASNFVQSMGGTILAKSQGINNGFAIIIQLPVKFEEGK